MDLYPARTFDRSYYSSSCFSFNKFYLELDYWVVPEECSDSGWRHGGCLVGVARGGTRLNEISRQPFPAIT